MKSEAVVLKEVMLEASKLGLVVFRNNTGVLKDINGRPVKFGLCVGSSDLIGFDRKEGFFVAIECKATGKKATTKQLKFINQVNKSGGFGCVIDNVNKLQINLDAYKASR